MSDSERTGYCQSISIADVWVNTHAVFNQPAILEDYNAYDIDTALAQGVLRHGAGWAATG